MNSYATPTVQTVTDAQLSRLRTAAVRAEDYLLAAICDLAIDGTIDCDDYSTLELDEDRRLRDMSQEDAIAVCAEAQRDGK